MPGKLLVRAQELGEPAQAAREVAEQLVRALPRQRPVTLGLLTRGPHPGLTPTPWVLDGVLEALAADERTPVQLLSLGQGETSELLLRRAGRRLVAGGDARELVERPSQDRWVALRSRAGGRSFAVPRGLIGSSLLLVAPLLLRPADQGRATVRRWSGPLTASLAELGGSWSRRQAQARAGLRPSAQDMRRRAGLGHELLAEVFAEASLVLDATWAGALALAEAGPGPRASAPRGTARGTLESAASPSLAGELAAPDRVIGCAGLGRRSPSELAGLDRWLVRALGLTAVAGDLPGPDFDRSPGRWPTLELGHPAEPTRLADRAIAGLRNHGQRLQRAARSSRRGGALAALPARVSGRFAGLWTERWYGEHQSLSRVRQPGRSRGASGVTSGVSPGPRPGARRE